MNLIASYEDIELKKISSFYETLPYGKTDQPDFINAAAEIETSLSPQDLLESLLETENILGRDRKEKWGPRTIDIDILFYGNSIIETDNLKVPHPFLHNREFVLFPLDEIASEFVHPILCRTIGELKKNYTGAGILRTFTNL